MTKPKNQNALPRLFISHNLEAEKAIPLSEKQNHYLRHVLRLEEGNKIRLFNGIHGEWLALYWIKKHSSEAIPIEKIKEQPIEKTIVLCPAVIKKIHFDFMIMKATELGVTQITPCFTSRTQVREVNLEHCHSIAIEAAEQSERLSIPVLNKPNTLKEIAKKWDKSLLPIICAEKSPALPIAKALQQIDTKVFSGVAFFTGPEGGYSNEDFALLQSIQNAIFVRLGPRILRADTAAISAISCFQALCGDWL